jgi:O-antigen/teichoic acid export membrane protein
MENSFEGKIVTRPVVSRQNGDAQQGPLGVAPADTLKGKSVRGGAATVLGQGVGMALQIGTTVVLARLLSPTDYGLQSMVLTLTAFFSLFKDAGLSVATVQRESLTHEEISTLFWINLALGALLTIVVVASSPFLAAFYKDPRLLWLTIASASIFLFNSLSVQHKALLDRAMRFSTSVKIDILSATIGSAVAIVMAALGCGYWSLICQNISLPIVGTAATWIALPWMPGRPRWTAELRSMVRFGGTVTLNSVVVYIAYNTEKILLGRFWGAAPLGIYTRAYQLATLPVQQLIGAAHNVAFSVLSRMQAEAQRLQRAYLKSVSMIVSLTIPVVISTAIFSDEIVLVVLGPKWIGVATVLRLLSPTVLVFALINPFSWFLRATGRVGRSLNIAFLITPVVILGILAGLRHGPAGVAVGYSTAMVLLFVPVVAWAIHGTGITTPDYWNAIKRPLISGVLGGLTGWLAKFEFHSALSPVAMLIFGLTLSFAMYAGTLLFVMGQREFFADLLSHLFQRNRALPTES